MISLPILTPFLLGTALLIGVGPTAIPIYCDCPTLEGAGTSSANGTWVWTPFTVLPGDCTETCEEDESGCYWNGVLEWHRPAGRVGTPWMSMELLGDDPQRSDKTDVPGDPITGVVLLKIKKTTDCGGYAWRAQGWDSEFPGVKDDFWFECGVCTDI